MKQALVTGYPSLVTLLAISLLPMLLAPAQAADRYPVRPVRMIVPYPPGGGSDLTGRAIAQKLIDSLGQTIVVDNRPGATGLIGTELAAKAPADGYTRSLDFGVLYSRGRDRDRNKLRIRGNQNFFCE